MAKTTRTPLDQLRDQIVAYISKDPAVRVLARGVNCPQGVTYFMAKKTTESPKQRRPVPSDEQRVDLELLPINRDGGRVSCPGYGKALPKVNVGRTDSERGLRFKVVMQPGAEPISFVLDRGQVAALHTVLKLQLTRIVVDD